jgi:hypothetical protein
MEVYIHTKQFHARTAVSSGTNGINQPTKMKGTVMNMNSESMGSLNQIAASESTHKQPFMKRVVCIAMATWLGLVFLLGAKGAFIGAPGSPPLPIFFGLAIPLAVFFAAYFGWARFREFILGADLRLVAAIQGWRWAGLGFLSLYAHRILPGLFAFPAGLGDMAIGFTAPWIVLGLIRQPSFASSRRFVVWNILGILDLVVAVSLGTLCSGFISGLTGDITTGPMARLPLNLIPAYLVPFFIMLHFTALAQSRRMRAFKR